MIETAKSLERKLGISTAHIVKKKVVEDAQKALKFTEVIQSIAAEMMGEMMMSTMQVVTPRFPKTT